MQNSKGTILAKHNVACHKCGRIVGPKYAIKMVYVQYGAGAGTFCSPTCCKAAYEEVTKAHPELKTKEEHIFGSIK